MMRRLFPCLMIATLALFGLTACQQAEEPAEAATAAAEAAGAAAEEAVVAATAAAEAAGAAAEEAVVAAEEADAVAGEMVDEAAAEAEAAYEAVSAKLAGKKDELAAVQQKISEMSPQDLLTDDGKALKDKADSLMAEIGGLEGELKALME